jgi:putative intracellular protease/amidase
VLLILGGLGNRLLLKNHDYLNLLRKNVEAVIEVDGVVLCVCTGSILLTATSLLDGKTATTNKSAYDKLTNVQRKRQARWVVPVDGKFISNSGITAGMVRVLG